MSAKPIVWLLGDSIRMSYQPLVANALAGIADVIGPAENGQFSLYTLSSLNRWIQELGKPDVVHWNNGIHDAGRNPDRRPVQIPLPDYRGNIELVLRRLREMTPHVIWATSTPVHPDRPFAADQWSWRNQEIDRYNQAALDVMRAHDVPVNDLHALVWEDYARYLAPDQLHLSEAGQRASAEAVVRAVIALLDG